ncbi:MAG: HAD-IA family hydrolase [Candidatus Latescibacteria bacterium]|nr:HAD-IA family hydrolase [Candidatus Latescibacterota bacterium]
MGAVFFDLYETLITENHPEWFGDVSLAERLAVDEDIWHREWRLRHQARMTGQIPDHGAVLRQICEVAGVAPLAGRIKRLVAERIESKARPFERVESDVIEMLQALRQHDLSVGLITNCTQEEAAAWDASPFADLVDVAVFSYQVGVIKPDPEIYTFACGRLGVEPADAHFVGDGGSDELRGARAAGLQPIWATWFIERWPWDWPASVADTAAAFPRCSTVGDLPGLLGVR